MIETLLYISFGFILGILARQFLYSQKNHYTSEEHCPNCQMQVFLPNYCRWEYHHSCDHTKCETHIKKLTIADLVEPLEDKTPGEGKTLC